MSERFPFTDFPSGWYAVGVCSDLPLGGVRTEHYFDRELVLYRTKTGNFRVSDPYCPHLGGHLGLGRVDGEELRCGFHGWKFDGAGTCVRAYGKGLPKARVGCWRTLERNQLLLVWYDGQGEAPRWQPPEIDFVGWTPFRFKTLDFASHPQETSENSVDLGHFTQVHSFSRAWVLSAAQVEGPLLQARYGVTRDLGLPGPLSQVGIDASFQVKVHGLGYSYVEGEVPALSLRFRHLILSVPARDGRIHMRLGTSVRKLRSAALTGVLHRLAFKGLCDEVGSDVPFWESKRYVDRPVLAKGDGPVHIYRKWAKQFYPTSKVH